MSNVTSIGKNKIISVRSVDRAFGTQSNFGISLGQFNLNPTYCSWHQISIPNGFYNVNDTSSRMNITVYDASNTAWPVNITIPPANYNTTTLLNALMTGPAGQGLNATLFSVNPSAPATFFTASVNNINGLFTLSSSTTNWKFTINIALASLDWILGFRSNQSVTLVTSATGISIIDLRSYPCIYIRSSLISGNFVSAGGSDSVLAVVQNTALFTQTIFQRSPTPDIDLFPVSGQLSQVNFQLVDEFGHELIMNTGQDWEIQICLYFT